MVYYSLTLTINHYWEHIMKKHRVTSDLNKQTKLNQRFTHFANKPGHLTHQSLDVVAFLNEDKDRAHGLRIIHL